MYLGQYEDTKMLKHPSFLFGTALLFIFMSAYENQAQNLQQQYSDIREFQARDYDSDEQQDYSAPQATQQPAQQRKRWRPFQRARERYQQWRQKRKARPRQNRWWSRKKPQRQQYRGPETFRGPGYYQQAQGDACSLCKNPDFFGNNRKNIRNLRRVCRQACPHDPAIKNPQYPSNLVRQGIEPSQASPSYDESVEGTQEFDPDVAGNQQDFQPEVQPDYVQPQQTTPAAPPSLYTPPPPESW